MARADTARLSHSPTAATGGGGSLWLAVGPQQQQAPSRSPSQQLEGGGAEAGGWAAGPGGPESAQECRVTPAGSAVVVSPLKFQVDQLIYIGEPPKYLQFPFGPPWGAWQHPPLAYCGLPLRGRHFFSACEGWDGRGVSERGRSVSGGAAQPLTVPGNALGDAHRPI